MNDLRRIKAKLQLLTDNTLPTKQLMLDLIRLCYPSNAPENSVEFFSKQLQSMYTKKIEELTSSSKFKQIEIEYE